MSPEQRQELRSKGARQAFDPFQSLAGGGLLNKQVIDQVNHQKKDQCLTRVARSFKTC